GAAHGTTGLGIGLALAKQLVELHEGTIEVASDGPGRGSCFTVRVPVHGSAGDEPGGDAPAVTVPVQRRFLLIDDNRDAADGMAVLIELMGVTARVAYDGSSALEAARELRPDVVLLDLGMPGVDGYELCQGLRDQPGGRVVSVVAAT